MIEFLLLAGDHLRALFPGYAVTIILLLIFSAGIEFLKTKKTMLLSAANIGACIIAGLLALVWITELIYYYNNPEGIDHTFFRYLMPLYVIPLILMISASILPLFRKLRRSMIIAFVMIILLNTAVRIDTIWQFITSFDRDYLPSSWSYLPAAWYERPLWVLLHTAGFMLLTYLIFILGQWPSRTSHH